MNIETLQDICSKFAGVTEDIKWECHLCFCVAEKIFIITSPDDVPISASFKVSEEEFDELTERDGFKQAAHLAKRQWVRIDDINLMSKKEWEQRARNAYDLIKAKLPKKIQASLK